MSDLDRTVTVDALDAVYAKMTTAVAGLSEADLMLPSRCAGWAVSDVLYHELLDARRALRTFASPSAAPVDVDDVTYWRSFSPGGADNAEHARHVRIAASAYPAGGLAWEWGKPPVRRCERRAPVRMGR